jgi:hypothetical protein
LYSALNEKYFGCTGPAVSFKLEGLDPSLSNYEITFFPTVYPNPTTDEFVISVPLNIGVYQASIYDVTGRLIKSTTEAQSEVNASLKNYPKAVYYIKIKSRDQYSVKKIILQ